MVCRRGMTPRQEFAERLGTTLRKAETYAECRMPLEALRLVVGRKSQGGKTEAVRARLRRASKPNYPMAPDMESAE